MRILVVSDIHANLIALDAVIRDAGSFQQVWCLGDIVGYGPQPNDTIRRLRQFDLTCVAGNHDLGVAGRVGVWDFSADAREMIFWTRHWLSLANFDWLASLPNQPLNMGHGITLVHASPRDPTWEYIGDRVVARENLDFTMTPVCLNGHTHLPVIYRKPWDGVKMLEERLPVDQPIRLTMDRMFINPGSVGQPRDDDPRAAYAVIDLDAMTLTHHRVIYDVSAVQKLMREENLPIRQIRRLRFGQ